MQSSRRELLKGLLSLPFITASVVTATPEQPGNQKKQHSDASKFPGSMCLHFEGVFGYLVYADHIEVFTPSLPQQHEYCTGLGNQRIYGYPPGDFDLTSMLPNVNGRFGLVDKTSHILLARNDAEITNSDFSKRYWRFKIPIPTEILAEGDPTMVKQPFSGKHAKLVDQLKQIQTSYQFRYELDEATSKKLHVSSVRDPKACAADIRYCVAPKYDDYRHAVSAFHELRTMLPNLDLDMKPNIGHPKTDIGKMQSLDEYVMDAHVFLCTAPSIFVTGM